MLVLSAVLIAARQSDARDGLRFWTFSALHEGMYQGILAGEGREHAPLDMSVLSIPALERRLLSGFLAGTSVADLVEVERQIVGRSFLGPPETIGFVDLRERLEREGLLDEIHPAALSPWSYQGGVYGLPHDVHPVMLMYRADIVEAAGIDVSRVETWDDFERVFAPLMGDGDGDGAPDRYLLGLSLLDTDKVELLMLQGGDGYFDADGLPTIATQRNARVAARLVRWCAGPTPIAADIPDFSASGNQQKLSGYGVAFFAPDWMCSIVRVEMPALSGKVKVMPLPAWEAGGRRTSAWGGTMLGVTRAGDSIDEAWQTAKDLYLSRELVERLYEELDIVTPLRRYWDAPMYDRPDPFFSGQAKGRLYVDLIEQVPERTSSPYHRLAQSEVQTALLRLSDRLGRDPQAAQSALEAAALELLGEAESRVKRQMARNAFIEVTP